MMQINAKVLVSVLIQLERIRALIDAHSEHTDGIFNPNIEVEDDIKATATHNFQALREALLALGAHYSVKSVNRLLDNLNDSGFVMKFSFLQTSAQVISTRIMDELGNL